MHRLEENIGSTVIEFTPEELEEIQKEVSKIEPSGDRYSEGSAKTIDR
jgi:hypothetical protein